MNLKQLLFAQKVAETGSFSKAAEACFATQPTLSNAINQLEKELGGKLFIRTTRKVALTAFGEHLLPLINTLLNDKNELEKAAHAYHNPQQKLIRIGLSPLINMKLLNQVLTPFQQSHPLISIFFKECLLDDLSQRLANEQIDFAVTPQNMISEDKQACFFYEEPLYYLPQELTSSVPADRSFRIDELPETQIILTAGGCGLNASLDKIFQCANTKFKRYPGQALSYKVIEEWASLGIGAGILPNAKISSGNKSARPLLLANGKPAKFSYEWSWTNRAPDREDIAEFIEYLSTTVPSLIKGESRFAVA